MRCPSPRRFVAPVMTLPRAVLFPGAVMPLHIFEPRYRAMLRDALAGDRRFAVVAMNEGLAQETGRFEPPHRVGVLGEVRAHRMNDDGTSNLLLHGLHRARVFQILRELPYRMIEWESVVSVTGDPRTETRLRLRDQRLELVEAIEFRSRIADGPVLAGMLKQLEGIEDDEAFIDLAVYNLCGDTAIRQRLLETEAVAERYARFLAILRKDNCRCLAEQRMGGSVPGDPALN